MLSAASVEMFCEELRGKNASDDCIHYITYVRVQEVGLLAQVVKPGDNLKVCFEEPRLKEVVEQGWRVKVLPVTDEVDVSDSLHLRLFFTRKQGDNSRSAGSLDTEGKRHD